MAEEETFVSSEDLLASPAGAKPEKDDKPPSPCTAPTREVASHIRTKGNARHQTFSSDSSPDPEAPPAKKPKPDAGLGH